ncbi:uncharacterized protein BJ171DRAFT_119944 [Polychytrium aggregatum]|uniref:uncharacterized protein n=1 Tax=Polychytrium aggregatum TaxID=110093 RepID=UPI0022FE9597|nr:uncharacterized protein BJ171DRAFT_119944 [Polychytrium aggregatum]KAI9204177.1 hypothetical protein BJ171DRAFT_119944 [Polychytrium aggregatum]
MLHVACCMLHVACCMLHVACRVLHIARCMLTDRLMLIARQRTKPTRRWLCATLVILFFLLYGTTRVSHEDGSATSGETAAPPQEATVQERETKPKFRDAIFPPPIDVSKPLNLMDLAAPDAGAADMADFGAAASVEQYPGAQERSPSADSADGSGHDSRDRWPGDGGLDTQRASETRSDAERDVTAHDDRDEPSIGHQDYEGDDSVLGPALTGPDSDPVESSRPRYRFSGIQATVIQPVDDHAEVVKAPATEFTHHLDKDTISDNRDDTKVGEQVAISGPGTSPKASIYSQWTNGQVGEGVAGKSAVSDEPGSIPESKGANIDSVHEDKPQNQEPDRARDQIGQEPGNVHLQDNLSLVSSDSGKKVPLGVEEALESTQEQPLVDEQLGTRQLIEAMKAKGDPMLDEHEHQRASVNSKSSLAEAWGPSSASEEADRISGPKGNIHTQKLSSIDRSEIDEKRQIINQKQKQKQNQQQPIEALVENGARNSKGPLIATDDTLQHSSIKKVIKDSGKRTEGSQPANAIASEGHATAKRPGLEVGKGDKVQSEQEEKSHKHTSDKSTNTAWSKVDANSKKYADKAITAAGSKQEDVQAEQREGPSGSTPDTDSSLLKQGWLHGMDLSAVQEDSESSRAKSENTISDKGGDTALSHIQQDMAGISEPFFQDGADTDPPKAIGTTPDAHGRYQPKNAESIVVFGVEDTAVSVADEDGSDFLAATQQQSETEGEETVDDELETSAPDDRDDPISNKDPKRSKESREDTDTDFLDKMTSKYSNSIGQRDDKIDIPPFAETESKMKEINRADRKMKTQGDAVDKKVPPMTPADKQQLLSDLKGTMPSSMIDKISKIIDNNQKAQQEDKLDTSGEYWGYFLAIARVNSGWWSNRERNFLMGTVALDSTGKVRTQREEDDIEGSSSTEHHKQSRDQTRITTQPRRDSGGNSDQGQFDTPINRDDA